MASAELDALLDRAAAFIWPKSQQHTYRVTSGIGVSGTVFEAEFDTLPKAMRAWVGEEDRFRFKAGCWIELRRDGDLIKRLVTDGLHPAERLRNKIAAAGGLVIVDRAPVEAMREAA